MRRNNSEDKPRRETPLKYFLRVMNDPDATWERRDDAARQALPYCHSRKSEYATRTGKKEQRQERAETMTRTSKWGGRLRRANEPMAYGGSRLGTSPADGSKSIAGFAAKRG